MVDIAALPGAPEWFTRALVVPFADERVTVEGADVHFLAWGEPGRRGLVFVHGGGAHAHWWTHVAATFATETLPRISRGNFHKFQNPRWLL